MTGMESKPGGAGERPERFGGRAWMSDGVQMGFGGRVEVVEGM